MLNPRPITDLIAATLAQIAPFATSMTVDGVVQIAAFHYLAGAEDRLMKAIYGMRMNSALVVFEGTKGGNFNGCTIWKHRWAVYMRMGNAVGNGSVPGYEDLWWTICNVPPQGSAVNIRYMQLATGLDIMDTPSVEHMLDQDGIDFFKATFVIPEIGDN